MILKHVAGGVMWPGSLQIIQELNMSDYRDKLVDVPGVESAVDLGFGQC